GWACCCTSRTPTATRRSSACPKPTPSMARPACGRRSRSCSAAAPGPGSKPEPAHHMSFVDHFFGRRDAVRTLVVAPYARDELHRDRFDEWVSLVEAAD